MYKKVISTFVLCLWMLLIFSLSAQPATASSELSGSVQEKLVQLVGKIAPKLAESIRNGDGVWEMLTTIVRKSAHFMLYLILGVLAVETAWAYDIREKRFLLALILCFLYAVSDEVHQIFVSGRAGRAYDVLVDTLGALSGIGLAEKFFKKRVDKKKSV